MQQRKVNVRLKLLGAYVEPVDEDVKPFCEPVEPVGELVEPVGELVEPTNPPQFIVALDVILKT